MSCERHALCELVQSVDKCDNFLPVEETCRVPQIFLRCQQDLNRGAQTEDLQFAPHLALLTGHAVHYASNIAKPLLELFLQLLLLQETLAIVTVSMHPVSRDLGSMR